MGKSVKNNHLQAHLQALSNGQDYTIFNLYWELNGHQIARQRNLSFLFSVQMLRFAGAQLPHRAGCPSSSAWRWLPARARASSRSMSGWSMLPPLRCELWADRFSLTASGCTWMPPRRSEAKSHTLLGGYSTRLSGSLSIWHTYIACSHGAQAAVLGAVLAVLGAVLAPFGVVLAALGVVLPTNSLHSSVTISLTASQVVWMAWN